MATNFGTALAVNGLGWEITTWAFRIKDGLYSVNPYVCSSLSLDSYIVAAIGIAPDGRLSGSELIL